MARYFWAALAGIVFAVGLAFSGMLHPAKVQGFLNIAGAMNGISWSGARGYWDPSLAIVMAGALMVTFFAFGSMGGDADAEADDQAEAAAPTEIDTHLLVGAALFGIGWALAGYCPGPAIASLSTGVDAITFCAAMLAAMWITKRIVSPPQPVQPAPDDDEEG
jgi:uncharacterized protein